MKSIVVYKSKYGSTKQYAEWIAEELGCETADARNVKPEDLKHYDTIIYGGGLYAEIIAGVTLITKNIDMFSDKKIIVYTTGITPIDCREYYDGTVVEKNFTNDTYSKIKMFNFRGKMILSELTPVHRAAIKMLKKMMSNKKDPTDMEKLLIRLCEEYGDFSDRESIKKLLEYAAE